MKNFDIDLFKAYTKKGLQRSLQFSRDKAQEQTNDPDNLKKANDYIDTLEVMIKDADYE